MENRVGASEVGMTGVACDAMHTGNSSGTHGSTSLVFLLVEVYVDLFVRMFPLDFSSLSLDYDFGDTVVFPQGS